MLKTHHTRSATQAARATRSSDARTLYLAPTTPLRVSSTGEALVVSHPDGRVMRLPVARVLRVVCADTTEWSGAALSLCLQRGISITWLNHQGEAEGHLWPCSQRRVALDDALDILAADSPDWSAHYANWLRHQRQGVLKRWSMQRSAAGQPVAVGEWERAKQSYVYRAEIGVHLPLSLHGMAAALVASRLNESGLQPHYWCTVGEPVALAADLTALVWAEMNLCTGTLADAIEQPAETATLFERWSLTCAGIVHEHLAHLHGQALRALAS